MDWQSVMDIFGLLGNIGSCMEGCCGSLVLVVIFIPLVQILMQRKEAFNQNALATSATIASVYQNVALTTIEIDRLFVENPTLRQYFYDNAVIEPGDPNYERVMSVAEMLLDHWDLIRVLEQATPSEVKQTWKEGQAYRLPWKGWRDYFVRTYTSSPAIRRYWAGNYNYYQRTLGPILDALPNEYTDTAGA